LTPVADTGTFFDEKTKRKKYKPNPGPGRPPATLKSDAEPKPMTTEQARLPTYKEVTQVIYRAILDLYRERGGKGTMGEYAVVRMGLKFSSVGAPHFWKRFRSELKDG
jgi:hypothetical protein